MNNLRNSFTDTGTQFSCQRKALRVDIQRSCCPVFVNYPELGEKKFPVTVLGELGAKYSTNGTKLISLTGHPIAARLFFGPIQAEVTTKMVYGGEACAALQFIEPSSTIRQMIRTTFELELTAASLMPFHNFSSFVPGHTHTTNYSDGESSMELFFSAHELVGMTGIVQALEVRFLWSNKNPGLFKIIGLDDDRTQGPELRRQLVSFVHNLHGLSPDLISALEKVIGFSPKPYAI